MAFWSAVLSFLSTPFLEEKQRIVCEHLDEHHVGETSRFDVLEFTSVA